MSHVSAQTAGLHIRDHRSMLAEAEKRLLIAMARRLPKSINSDHLSGLGLAAIILAGVSFALMSVAPGAAWGVVAALALNWYGDSLDGTLARVRGHQRPRYGYYVDHVIDIAGTSALMLGLATSTLIHPVLALSLLVVYLLLCAESYLGTHAAGVFRMSFLGFGPTELRLVLIAGALKAAQNPVVSLPAIGTVRLFDVGAVFAIAGMLFAFIVSSVRTTRMLYEAEPLPSGEHAERAA
ncbi:MAG: CDP-alcohol phosphatidyltransferase family protein [Vicinamibacterales bacterium]